MPHKTRKTIPFILIVTLLAVSVVSALAAPLFQENTVEVVCVEDYEVQDDDWLSRVAEKFYGDPLAFPAIFQATQAAVEAGGNYATLLDPNVIEVGQILCIPSAEVAEALLAGAQAVMGEAGATEVAEAETTTEPTATETLAPPDAEATATQAVAAEPTATATLEPTPEPSPTAMAIATVEATPELTATVTSEATSVPSPTATLVEATPEPTVTATSEAMAEPTTAATEEAATGEEDSTGNLADDLVTDLSQFGITVEEVEPGTESEATSVPSPTATLVEATPEPTVTATSEAMAEPTTTATGEAATGEEDSTDGLAEDLVTDLSQFGVTVEEVEPGAEPEPFFIEEEEIPLPVEEVPDEEGELPLPVEETPAVETPPASEETTVPEEVGATPTPGEIAAEETEEAATAPATEPDAGPSTFAEALGTVTRSGALPLNAPLTIFVPTRNAFSLFSQGELRELLADPATVQRLVLQHIIYGNVLSQDLSDAPSVVSLGGEPLTISTEEGTVRVEDAEIVAPNFQFGNVVIHVIDSVLLPAEYQ